MNLKRSIIWAPIIAIAAFGAVIIIDRIPEVDPNPANGPISNITILNSTLAPLTTLVKDPAGIVFLQDTNTYLVSTDNREILEISNNFSSVISKITLPNAPLSIGDTEGITYLGNGKAAVAGENGVIILLERINNIWQEQERFAITNFVASTQLGSLTYDAATQTLYTAQKKKQKRLYSIHLPSKKSTMVEMALSANLHEKQSRKWQEFTIAGMQFSNGLLYAISEEFNSLLIFTPHGELKGAHGLANVNESSGITISFNKTKGANITLIGDAEGYLPDPPVYFIDMPL